MMTNGMILANLMKAMIKYDGGDALASSIS